MTEIAEQKPGTGQRPPVQRVAVDLGERSYEVVIGSSLLDDPGVFAALPRAHRALLVTNDVVGPLLGERARVALGKRFQSVSLLSLPDGEETKRWDTLNTIFDALLAEQADRSTTLVALGGGVVGDITGFAAACFMRGIPHVQLPTTLLAQVDSSVGGKTAINHPAGKNMIGAFHQPSLVVADVDTLKTLPKREFVSGLAEVIKYGATLDPEFLDWIEAHLDRLLAREPEALIHAVRRSCEIKAAVVAADEHEAGSRAILNFGHTFGHAYEAALGYGSWLHGEAVGLGMVQAARLSVRLGLIEADRAGRLERLVARAGLPTRAPAIDPVAILRLMEGDKKAVGGQQRYVLLDGAAGACVRPADASVVTDVIRQSQGA
jgi:3-dehydroquinate synthase